MYLRLVASKGTLFAWKKSRWRNCGSKYTREHFLQMYWQCNLETHEGRLQTPIELWGRIQFWKELKKTSVYNRCRALRIECYFYKVKPYTEHHGACRRTQLFVWFYTHLRFIFFSRSKLFQNCQYLPKLFSLCISEKLFRNRNASHFCFQSLLGKKHVWMDTCTSSWKRCPQSTAMIRQWMVLAHDAYRTWCVSCPHCLVVPWKCGVETFVAS